MDDASANASVALSRAIQHYPSDDPRYAPTFAESIAETQALKLDDAIAFYRTYWGADHADMAIVGDFDPVAVKAEVTRLFGDWKSSVPYVRIANPVTDVAGLHLVTPLKDKANATLVAVAAAEDARHRPRLPGAARWPRTCWAAASSARA